MAYFFKLERGQILPIYEFYCKRCNTVFQFYSRTINTNTIPRCPKCKRPKLERILSGFATFSPSDRDETSGMDLPDVDETKIEKAMSMLDKNMDKIDENDPRQAARLMRELTNATGLEMGDSMEEALGRLEKGEDPEKIEKDMGDLLDGEDQLFKKSRKSKTKNQSPKPSRDETLYELD